MPQYFASGIEVPASDVGFLASESAKAYAAYLSSLGECEAKAIAAEQAGVESVLADRRVAKAEKKLRKRRDEAATRLATLEAAKAERATAGESVNRYLQIFNVAYEDTNRARHHLNEGESK